MLRRKTALSLRIFLPEQLKRIASLSPVPVYLVGGAVRNALAGLADTRDYDLCAPMPAEDFRALAERCGVKAAAVYKNTGTVLLSMDGCACEFTSFRTDFYRTGAHVPVSVTFTDDIVKDARRRDFRCNAVYYDIAKEAVLDPLNGTEDIKTQILRTTRSADEVFSEDGLRLMRLARLAAEIGFTTDTDCLRAAKENAPLIKDVAPERILTELNLLLHADEKYGRPFAHYDGLKILDETRVLDEILPELAQGRGMTQRSDFHDHDVLEHSLRACRYADRRVRLSALLHDVGKPAAFLANGNYHGHDVIGEPIGRQICERLRVPKKQADIVCRMIALHMYDLDGKVRERKLRLFILRNYDVYGLLCLVKQADYSGCKDRTDTCPTLYKWDGILKMMMSENVPLSLKDLAVNGNDLLPLVPAKQIGGILKKLQEACAAGELKNERNALLARAAKFSAVSGQDRE